MRAVVFENGFHVTSDFPEPEAPPGWARIRVKTTGICKTDLELLRGYMGFSGVLGHEFIGTVESCENRDWAGRRVSADINAACGRCDWCRKGLGRHCPHRTTLGIDRLHGCMADFCVVPVPNLIEIPDSISDDRAVFIEPLSAACEIIDQLSLNGDERVVVLGDGRLGILCAWVLSTVVSNVVISGHHAKKLQMAAWNGVRTILGPDIPSGADVVVEATGSATGFVQAMSLCRPRGVLVLKSTIAASEKIHLAPLVIHEITVVGSRCGLLSRGLTIMERYPDMPIEKLITDRFPVEQAVTAFERASGGSAVKVLIDIG